MIWPDNKAKYDLKVQISDEYDDTYIAKVTCWTTNEYIGSVQPTMITSDGTENLIRSGINVPIIMVVELDRKDLALSHEYPLIQLVFGETDPIHSQIAGLTINQQTGTEIKQGSSSKRIKVQYAYNNTVSGIIGVGIVDTSSAIKQHSVNLTVKYGSKRYRGG